MEAERRQVTVLVTLLRNLPTPLGVFVTAFSRIRAQMAVVVESPCWTGDGHFVSHAQLILGLLYKIKKKRALAVQHLTEAKRILSQFGQTPILARVETALADIGAIGSDVAYGSWLCRNALPEVSKRSGFGRVALRSRFLGLARPSSRP